MHILDSQLAREIKIDRERAHLSYFYEVKLIRIKKESSHIYELIKSYIYIYVCIGPKSKRKLCRLEEK